MHGQHTETGSESGFIRLIFYKLHKSQGQLSVGFAEQQRFCFVISKFCFYLDNSYLKNNLLLEMPILLNNSIQFI